MKKIMLSAAIVLLFGLYSKAQQTSAEYLKIAMDKLNAKDYDGAISYFNEAEAASKGKDSSVFYNRGIAKLNLKRKEEACADFKKAKEHGYKEADKKITESCK